MSHRACVRPFLILPVQVFLNSHGIIERNWLKSNSNNNWQRTFTQPFAEMLPHIVTLVTLWASQMVYFFCFAAEETMVHRGQASGLRVTQLELIWILWPHIPCSSHRTVLPYNSYPLLLCVTVTCVNVMSGPLLRADFKGKEGLMPCSLWPWYPLAGYYI